MPIRAFAVRFAAVLLWLAAAVPAVALSPVNKSLLGGIAIDGFDPVAYFTEGRPVEGSKSWSHHWNGATWRFSSLANRDRFVEEPTRYAPQYGGYCAWAVANGYTAGIDPEAWAIRDGKLYLNYNLEIREKWMADVPGHISKADANWPKLLVAD